MIREIIENKWTTIVGICLVLLTIVVFVLRAWSLLSEQGVETTLMLILVIFTSLGFTISSDGILKRKSDE